MAGLGRIKSGLVPDTCIVDTSFYLRQTSKKYSKCAFRISTRRASACGTRMRRRARESLGASRRKRGVRPRSRSSGSTCPGCSRRPRRSRRRRW
eukprot:6975696-Prymnesium_polylepis.1